MTEQRRLADLNRPTKSRPPALKLRGYAQLSRKIESWIDELRTIQAKLRGN